MKKVLIIDDSEVLRRITAFNLQKMGYEIREAIDGVDGLEKIKDFHPDLVLLDIMMPRMDGFTVLKRMSEDPSMKEIPVIVLTAKGGEDDEKEALRLGAIKVLTKPFSPKQLVETVKQVIGNE
ncbi:MAG: response regulator [Thermotogae bacterium]|nr:response regulator [Thermotogota bacterium]HDM70702.1 response regulator [Thermotogales bacterium]